MSFNKFKILKIFFSGIFFIIILIPAYSLNAQENNLKFKHLTIEDGLSHSKVNCIYQDSEGFLWFGTNEGLNKYDSYKFTVYQWNIDDSTSISADIIRDIFEDSQNRLWIGTEAGGLNLYNRDRDQFIRFTADSSSPIQLPNNDINAILEDHQGQIWLGTGAGLTLLNMESQTAQTWQFLPETETSLQQNRVNALCVDNNHIVWIGTQYSGLIAFNPESEEFQHFAHEENNPASLSDEDVRSLYIDSRNNLWIGTYEGGLNRFNRQTQQFTHIYPDSSNPESATVRVMLEDGEGNLWLGTRNGLYNYNPQTGGFRYYYTDPHNPYSLYQHNILAIFRDKKGDLWFGTRGGISYLVTSTAAFVHFRADTDDDRCLNDRVVYAILEDRNGDIWFGTEEGGLNHLDRRTGKFTYYTHNPANPNSISSNNIKALHEDENGNIWISSFQGGLNILNRKTGRFAHYQHDPADPAAICSNNVRTIFEDSDGDFWIGTPEDGIDRFELATGRFKRVALDESIEGAQYLNMMMQDRQGNIWAGASESVFYRIDKQTNEIAYYKLPTHLSGIEVMSILEDKCGNLWIGSLGGGLFVFDRAAETFRVYDKNNALPSNNILNVLQDDDGLFWISSTNGLSRFDPETGNIKNYFKENGLQSDQFTGAALKTRNGQLFFGGINGVTAFFPQKIQENQYAPPVALTDFLIFNKPVPIGEKGGILQKHISQTQQITLSYKHSVFSFEFAALNYAISEQNQYAYIMENFETGWNYVGHRNFATYTNLNPGAYTFRVKAANNDGLWNERGASIDIVITPPFWETLWFKLLLAGIILLVIKHFYNYLQQKRNLLKAQALAHLAQLKLLRSQMNPHFLFNTLNSIRSMIFVSKDQAGQMVSELAEFFRYALRNYDKVEVPLKEEIEAANNYLAIEKVRFKDISDITFNVADDALNCVVPAFILQPLLENAIKHGKQTSARRFKVNTDIRCAGSTLSIDVSNTGKLKSTAQNLTPTEDDHGYSLDNIKKRLALMFDDRFSLELFEEAGWVHAKIRISYKERE